MISFFIGRARIRVQPMFLILCILCHFAGGRVLPALSMLALHELGHLMAARCFRLPLTQFDLTPFGGVFSFGGMDDLPRAKRFIVYAAGALMNALGLAALLIAFRRGVSPMMCAPYARAACLLLLFNLLPALPLDGGRMLLIILSLWIEEKKAARALLLNARLVGTALCGLSLAGALLGRFSFAPMSAGLYLFSLAAAEERSLPARYAHHLIERRLLLARRGALDARGIAVLQTEPLHALFPRLCDAKYHYLYVLNAKGALLGTVDEQKICSALFDNAEQTVGQLL